MHPITQRISDLMAEQGLTKADLSDAANIPYHRLNPWFIRHNAKPNAEDVRAVARALQVQVHFLLTGEHGEPPSERDWIINLYDSLPPEKRAQLEGFAKFLAEEAEDSRGTERRRREPRQKAGPNS